MSVNHLSALYERFICYHILYVLKLFTDIVRYHLVLLYISVLQLTPICLIDGKHVISGLDST